jgi:AraC-like DNA-binding protein
MITLLHAVRRYAEAHADINGLAQTPIAGLSAVRATAPSDLVHAVSRPLVCLVLQGAKNVTMGPQGFAFAAGESLLITADVPTVSQITRASAAAPYLSLVLELDATIIADLASQMGAEPAGDQAPVRIEPTDAEVADAALRLMRLLDRPASLPVLSAQLVRELHYWLLAGRHGAAIRRLGWPEGHVQRVARAVAVLRAEFKHLLPVERLAAVAGMSVSSFHQHFRAVTSLSPLQFQKQLRLIEARRLMLSEGASASSAAFAVGYESVPQFTREYGRMFGLSPVRDTKAARAEVRESAVVRADRVGLNFGDAAGGAKQRRA